MSDNPFSLWVYLAERPLTWLTLTLLAYSAADALAVRSGRHPLVNPVLIATVLVGAVLMLTGTPYAIYFDGAQFVHFLLGPATVALAVPLFRYRMEVRQALLPMAAALAAGSLVTLLSVVALLALFGVPKTVIAAMAPKSVTAAIAMAVSGQLGGDPALTAVLVILTGIFGAVLALPLLKLLQQTDERANGIAIGLAAHGIGTARAFQATALTGTFAAIAMALNAVLTALAAPLLFRLLGW